MAFSTFAETRAVHGECGGYMVLGAGLVDADGTRHAMCGLLGLETSFAKRKMQLGYRRAVLKDDVPPRRARPSHHRPRIPLRDNSSRSPTPLFSTSPQPQATPSPPPAAAARA